MGEITYEDIVRRVRATFEHADARNIFEHIAFEIDIVGQGAGAFYFEVAQRACVVEPYNYYDNDGIFTGDSEIILKLADKKIHLQDAIEKGLISFRGNEHKLKLCLNSIVIPGYTCNK